MAFFSKVPEHISFPEQELQILDLWDRIRAFERSVEQRSQEKNEFVFYDGPPFATGLPHYGHFMASTVKDTVARYWAMRGKHVERRFGWDTHGLPIEMETEKTLGLSGPKSIREYGIDKFNEACKSGVLRYTKEWRQIIRRLGRWVDFDNDYKTMDASFMESVWWVFSELWKKDLIYKGFRVMPYSWRLSTPLSNFEANLDYRDVQDPAVTIKLKLKGETEPTYLLIWTTTPWTLPSNLGVAVGPDLTYVKAKRAGDASIYIVAKERLEAVLGKETEILAELSGDELLGKHYEPLFPYFADNAPAFLIVSGHHVTTDAGTGLVHMAPAFGEDDYQICQAAGIGLVDPVDEEGNFTDAVPDFAGLNIKEADPKIIRHIKEAGLLFKHDTIQHSYPYCWRSGTPLIYKAVPVWFVKVTAFKDRMVAHNKKIHWVPESVGEKRFGNWLADAQDWSISRNRFWGTPIPVWQCDQCEHRICMGSIQELEDKTQTKIADLHSHHIDPLQFQCEKCAGTMTRIPEVFDCWFDTGAMPYAQIHYPFENKDAFEHRFPAQFIAEGLDQTRGWFYTLIVLSTALFDLPPFQNVVVNGMVLAEDGSKMSKSKKNYPDPMHILHDYGSDALRAYLINSPVVRAEPLLFSEVGVKEVVRTVLLPLYHAWSFFVQYANIDGWEPGKSPSPLSKGRNSELDRWILSKLQSLVAETNKQMEGYYLYKVVPPMMAFIDDLTNWYIRRSRRRFWKNATDQATRDDKESAYSTLYEVLVTFSKALAPVLPFVTELIYQNLVPKADSVHLCDYPKADLNQIDEALERDVAVIRQVVSMGRALREKHRLKTRQPLSHVVVVSHQPAIKKALQTHEELVCEELNVKGIQLLEHDDSLCDITIKPNFKTLGQRLGKRMKEASDIISKFSRAEFDRLQNGETLVVADEPITAADVVVTRLARADVVAETEGELTVALETRLSDDLIREGLAREVVSQLQRLRKEQGLGVTDRIEIDLQTDSDILKEAITQHEAYLKDELLALRLSVGNRVGENGKAIEIEDYLTKVQILRVS